MLLFSAALGKKWAWMQAPTQEEEWEKRACVLLSRENVMDDRRDEFQPLKGKKKATRITMFSKCVDDVPCFP